MARYKLILAYDGGAYWGSQRQARKRTVQGELERALRDLGWSDRAVLLAGRTDRGVHARGQVAAFDLAWPHAEQRLLSALNARLPADMSVQTISEASAAFHPRFDAVSRSYTYHVFFGPVRDPLRDRYAWRVWPTASEALLEETAASFLGCHDFSGFGSVPGGKGTSVRTVTRSEWARVNGEWQYRVTCEAFLYRMVRRIVFAQVAVAQGRCSPDAIRHALQRPAGARARPHRGIPAGLAPAQGLTLSEVSYGSTGQQWKRRTESVQDVLPESR